MTDFYDEEDDEMGKIKEFKKKEKEKDFDSFLKQKKWSRQNMDDWFGGDN